MDIDPFVDTLIADWISLRGGFDKNRPDSRDLYLASLALTSFGEKRRGNDGLNREGVRELGSKIEKIKCGNC